MSQDFPVPRQDRPRRPDGPDDRPEPTPEVRDVAPQVATPDGAVDVVASGRRPGAGGRGRRLLHRLTRDGRPVPAAGALGALAAFGSLVEDWMVFRLPAETGIRSDEPVVLASGVAELPTFGPVYVLGVLAATVSLALVLFGSPGIRRNARVAGLAVTGVVLGVLVALAGSLDRVTVRQWDSFGQFDGLATTEHGRGLVLAFVGTGLLGLALLLAGPFVRAAGATDPSPAAGADRADTADPADGRPETGPDWPWYRPRAGRASREPTDGEDDGTPIDLTVTPTKPFAY
jgi:hypothetical protein